jgi:thioesterase domain-containing protein/acyl carrier protein
MAEHPLVTAAAVVAGPDGSAGKRLVAFLVLAAAGDGLDPLAWLAERLPAHMVPSAWAPVEALPLNPNGKVDRAALAATLAGADRRNGVPQAATGSGRNGAGPPRTDTERRLAAIWGRLLDAGELGRDDDFFALGGHSLMTLRLFADIEAEFGRRLPVASIFESPTLAELARRIDTDGAEAAWKSLVPIAPTGWKRPFFCVHGAGGNVALFAKLGRALDPERPLYGLQAQGLDGTTRPHRQIEAMAAHYLTEIRGVQPRGPYLLGGICKGAQVALEMSQQLQATGQEVSLLVVLDSKHPNLYGAARRDARRRRQRRRQRSKARTAGERRLRLLRKRWRRTRLLVRRARRRSWAERIVAARNMLRPRPDSEHLKRVRRANSRAIRNYVARPFAGRIALIESERTARRPELAARAGWSRVASGGLDHVVAPGDHRSMLREPQVGVLAERLAALLDDAEGLVPRR